MATGESNPRPQQARSLSKSHRAKLGHSKKSSSCDVICCPHTFDFLRQKKTFWWRLFFVPAWFQQIWFFFWSNFVWSLTLQKKCFSQSHEIFLARQPGFKYPFTWTLGGILICGLHLRQLILGRRAARRLISASSQSISCLQFISKVIPRALTIESGSIVE